MEKKQARPNKDDHAGKSNREKEAYSRFLGRSYKFDFDKTLKDESDIVDTDTSKVDIDEEEEVGKENLRPKSLKYKTSDFFKNNLAISILSGIILLLFGLWVSSNRELGEIQSDLKYLSRDIQNIQTKYDNNNNVRNDLNLFKIEIKKDLESLQERVKKIEEKL